MVWVQCANMCWVHRLFDLQNPEKEIGRLSKPLLAPNTEEREGYVPNVVYSCGSMIHNNDLILPYAMSDYRIYLCHTGCQGTIECIEKFSIECTLSHNLPDYYEFKRSA